jgi:hypothetical protein
MNFLLPTILMVQLQSFQKIFLVIRMAPLVSSWRCRLPGTDGHCSDPQYHRIEQHDHQELSDSDRPGRHGSRQMNAPLGRNDRRDETPFATDCLDSRRLLG